VEEAIPYEMSLFIIRQSYLSLKSSLFINFAVGNSYFEMLCTKPRMNWHYCTNALIRLLSNECLTVGVTPSNSTAYLDFNILHGFPVKFVTTQRGFVS